MTATTPQATELGKRGRLIRGDIQGLRAIAVASVVLYHAGVPFLNGGYVGVDIFFVISGFLITSHLWDRLRLTGKIGFADFYAKRARRILPASFVVVIATIIASLIFIPPQQFSGMFIAAAATLLYVPNMLFAAQGSDYLADTAPSPFQQYWSLGVEEQFYLLWPLALVLAYILTKRHPKRLVFVIAALVVISFVACVALTEWRQPIAFYTLPARAWELGVGALAALVIHRLSLSPLVSALMGWIGLAGLVLSLFLLNETTVFPGFAAALPVVATALVILAGGRDPDAGAGKILGYRPMQFIGLISYSIYLVHWPLLTIPRLATLSDEGLPLWAGLLLAGLAVPLGWLLFRFIEQPLRNPPFLTAKRPRRTLVGVLVVTLVLITAIGGAFAVNLSRPLSSAQSIAASEPSLNPSGTSFVPSNVQPALRDALEDNASVYGTACHLTEIQTHFEPCAFGNTSSDFTVVVFGDSHAAQWFPALQQIAEDRDIRFESYSKSRCPSATIDKTYQNLPYAACDEWRDAVIDHILSSNVDMVILSNFTSSAGEKTQFVDQSRPTEEVWAEGITTTLKRLSTVPDVVVMEDTPHQLKSPLDCLSMNLDSALNCATPVDEAINEAIVDAETAATREGGGRYVSLNDYFCDSEVCPVLLGNVIVYRDKHHITKTFSLAMRGALESALFPVSSP